MALRATVAGFTSSSFAESPVLVREPGFPFERLFNVENAFAWAVLILEVRTAYSSFAKSASILINGALVGKVAPRPLPPLSGGSLIPFVAPEPVSIRFTVKDLVGLEPSGGRTGQNAMRIAPSGANDWLVVASWRMHYYVTLPQPAQ